MTLTFQLELRLMQSTEAENQSKGVDIHKRDAPWVDTIKQIFISITYLVRGVIIKEWGRGHSYARDLRTLTAVSRLNGLRADNCFYTFGVDDAIMLDDVQFDLRRRRGNIKMAMSAT